MSGQAPLTATTEDAELGALAKRIITARQFRDVVAQGHPGLRQQITERLLPVLLSATRDAVLRQASRKLDVCDHHYAFDLAANAYRCACGDLVFPDRVWDDL